MTDICEILEFLPCETPDTWIEEAIKPENLEILLIEHANNEFKTAQSAMSFMARYLCTPPEEGSKNPNFYELWLQSYNVTSASATPRFVKLESSRNHSSVMYWQNTAARVGSWLART